MIKVENLVKAFGAKRAVDGVSFGVERGEVLGFLGPNGAGKSTTMRMITGFMPPTAGKVAIGGHDVAESPIEAKRLIGYLPESAASYSDMTVRGFLNFAAEMRGLRGAARKKAVNRVVELCFLQSVLRQSIDTLSKGYRQRTCLAQALIHDPDVLVMDEPTEGLDPNQKHEIRNLIRELGASKAIVFSTHILEEVDAACTRAIIIDRGKIVANGTPEELRDMSQLAGAVTLSAHGASAEKLSELGRVEDLGGAFRIYPSDKRKAAELGAYFTSPVAYVFLVIFLLLTGFFTFTAGNFFERGEASLAAFFGWHPWVYLVLVPAVGMRLWAEERRSGTLELLLTMPVATWQAIVAKFLASWIFLALALVLTFPAIITVNLLGDPDNGIIAAGYLGSFLLAGAYLAVSCMTSAMTRNQVVAFILSVVLCLFLVLAGFNPVTDLMVRWASPAVVDTVAAFSVVTHYDAFQRGVIDSRNLVFFLSVIGFALFATGVIIRGHRSG